MSPSCPSVGDREPPLRRLVERGLRAVRVLEHDAQPFLGDREPRGDGPLGDAESLRDRAFGVAVVVAEHDRRRLLRRKLGERGREVAVLDELLGVGRESWPAKAADDLAHLAQAHLALVRDGRVDRDAMDPRFGRRYRLPCVPLLVSTLERVLGAVLGGGPVTEHRRQRAQDLSVRRLIESLEVRLVAGLVGARGLASLAGGGCRDLLCHIRSLTPHDFQRVPLSSRLALTLADRGAHGRRTDGRISPNSLAVAGVSAPHAFLRQMNPGAESGGSYAVDVLATLASGLGADSLESGKKALEVVRVRSPEMVALSEQTGEDLVTTSAGFIEMLLASLRNDVDLPWGEFEQRSRDYGRLRAAQGLPLESLIDVLAVYRRATMELISLPIQGKPHYDEIIALAQSRLEDITERLTSALARGYLDYIDEEHRARESEMYGLAAIVSAMGRSLDLMETAEVALVESLAALRLSTGAMWLRERSTYKVAHTVGLDPDQVDGFV